MKFALKKHQHQSEFKPELEPELEPESEPITVLQTLVSTTGFLNLHTLLQAGDLMLQCHTRLHLRLQSAPLHPLLITSFMDDTSRLMDSCNLLKSILLGAARCKIHVKYVIKTLLDEDKAKLEAGKVVKMLSECIGEVERFGSGKQHTGSSWLVLMEELSHGKVASKSKRLMMKPRIASKAMDEAKVVSVLVLTALFAAFGGDKTVAFQDQTRQQHKTQVWRLREGMREEVVGSGSGCPVIVLEGVSSGLKEILGFVQTCKGGEVEEVKLKALVQQASKRLEYFESGLGILEEQMGDLFAKLVANRNLVLSRSTL